MRDACCRVGLIVVFRAVTRLVVLGGSSEEASGQLERLCG